MLQLVSKTFQVDKDLYQQLQKSKHGSVYC